jgi:hypothetical protein
MTVTFLKAIFADNVLGQKRQCLLLKTMVKMHFSITFECYFTFLFVIFQELTF